MSLKSNITAKAMPRMIKSTRRYATHVGKIMVAYLKRKVSKPVVIQEDGKIERSLKYEYPRKETGSLQASIDFEVDRVGNRIRLTFGAMHDVRLGGQDTSPTLYARYLTREWRGRLFASAAWNKANEGKGGALRKALSRLGISYKHARLYGRTYSIGKGSPGFKKGGKDPSHRQKITEGQKIIEGVQGPKGDTT